MTDTPHADVLRQVVAEMEHVFCFGGLTARQANEWLARLRSIASLTAGAREGDAALEDALREYEREAYKHGKTDENAVAVDAAADKLRRLFATTTQPQGEAVAWQQRHRSRSSRPWSEWEECDRDNYEAMMRNPQITWEARALYTTPPAAPTEAAADAEDRVDLALEAFGKASHAWQSGDRDEPRNRYAMRAVVTALYTAPPAAPTEAAALAAKWEAEGDGYGRRAANANDALVAVSLYDNEKLCRKHAADLRALSHPAPVEAQPAQPAQAVTGAFWRESYRAVAYQLYRRMGHTITAADEMADADLESREREYAALHPAPSEARQSFQEGVAAWMEQCFSPAVCHNTTERGDRLLEEVLELLQSHDYDRSRVATLVEYVWNRPKGEPAQEVGGVMVTLAAYCWIAGINMHDEAVRELARITQPAVMAKIRAKQDAKNALHFDTPLPGGASEARQGSDCPKCGAPTDPTWGHIGDCRPAPAADGEG
jgi:hypothetical protein